MKFAISTHLFVYHIFSQQIIRLLKECGAEHIELWCAEGHVSFTGEFVNKLKRWCGSEINVVMGHGPFYDRVTVNPRERVNFTLSDPGDAGKLAFSLTLKAADLLQALGAEIMVLHTGFGKGNLDERQDVLAERILKILEITDLKIALETEPHTLTTASSIYGFLCSYFPDNHRTGICVDVGHANVVGGVMEELKNAGDKLLAIHASDNPGDFDLHLVPGEGNIDWRKLLSFLQHKGWNGVFSFEVRDQSRGKKELLALKEIVNKCLLLAAEITDVSD